MGTSMPLEYFPEYHCTRENINFMIISRVRVHNSGACQLTIPTRLRIIDLVDCLNFANPKSAIFATPLAVMRILEDLQSRCMIDGFLV